MMGAAHEWLDVLRDWEDEHLKPQLELERLATSEAEHDELLRAKTVKSASVKKSKHRANSQESHDKETNGKKEREEVKTPSLS